MSKDRQRVEERDREEEREREGEAEKIETDKRGMENGREAECEKGGLSKSSEGLFEAVVILSDCGQNRVRHLH